MGKGSPRESTGMKGSSSRDYPAGQGTYRWASGVYYEGEWKNGMREGEGKMVYPDSTVTGIWKEDKYQGESNPALSR